MTARHDLPWTSTSSSPVSRVLVLLGRARGGRIAPPRPLLAAAVMVALTGAGCSNAPAGTGGGADGGGDQDAPAGAAPDPAEQQVLLEKLPEYAQCMRENGVEDFPDPAPDGTIQYHGDSPELMSASEKCDHLLPEDRGGNR